MKTRQAAMRDAREISAFLQELTALGKRTIPSSYDYVCENYIEHEDNVRCTVAEDEKGMILGLQVLKLAREGNSYGVAPGWGIVGTHVSPDAARRGVGRTLFLVTRDAAEQAGLTKIDATIAAENAEGLAYYDAMGFRTYRTVSGKICKLYDLLH